MTIRHTAPPTRSGTVPRYLEGALLRYLLLMLFLGGSIGCVITGFVLPVTPSVLLWGIPLIAAYPVICAMKRNLQLLQLLPAVTILLWIWLRSEPLREGFSYAAAVVMRILCRGYPDLAMPQMLSEHEQFLIHAETNTLLLSSIQAPITEMLLCFALLSAALWLLLYQRMRCVLLCALLPLPAFVLCFLIIDATVPAFWALLCVLVYWILLLFTRSAIRLHTHAAAAQAAFLLLPGILFVSAVYLWYPRQTPVGDLVQDGYDRVMTTLTSIEATVSDSMSDLFSGTSFTVSAEGDEISFDALNTRRFLGRTVMRAKCDTTGVLYLREKTYGAYTANGWEQADDERDPFFEIYADLTTLSADILAESGVSASHLSLDGARSPLLFTPYYFADATADYRFAGDRHINNIESTPDYDISFYRFSGNFDDLPSAESALMLQIMVPQYLKIDSDLADKLRDILSENGIAAADRAPYYMDQAAEIKRIANVDDIWDAVAEITYFVRDCAEYSLNASQNTTDRDFVLWFLEDAEYGYCTHFATAEVLLLRACGIPARLAAGYLCNIRQADQWTAVKDSNAHAWVEVFDERLGWVPVEATPPTALTPDMDEANVIVGMTPIPGESTEDTEEPTTETVPVEDTAPTTDETQEISDPTAPKPPPQTADTTSDNPLGIGQGGIGTGIRPAASSPLTILLLLIGNLMLILLLPFMLILLLVVRRRIRRRHIEAQFCAEEDERNRSALRIYRRCLSLARACGEDIPGALTALAEKARFSQHTLTQEELAYFRSWYLEKCAQLRAQDTPLQRLRHYWIDIYD
ncbi:MAG: transglutaminase domain-containing protein [Clostridia bacterium]|nr:transglutaminase domain-containing protein [Clostridia bacterium]